MAKKSTNFTGNKPIKAGHVIDLMRWVGMSDAEIIRALAMHTEAEAAARIAEIEAAAEAQAAELATEAEAEPLEWYAAKEAAELRDVAEAEAQALDAATEPHGHWIKVPHYERDQARARAAGRAVAAGLACWVAGPLGQNDAPDAPPF